MNKQERKKLIKKIALRYREFDRIAEASVPKPPREKRWIDPDAVGLLEEFKFGTLKPL